MTATPRKIAVIGAGINGLVAANYLQRAGHKVTLLERSHRVGGACVSETAVIDGVRQDYALGASTLGLMQDFVWQETGLADRLDIWAVDQPDRVFFPGDTRPTLLHDDAAAASREFAENWGEKGDIAAYFADEERVVEFLREGYRAGQPPSVDAAVLELGEDLASLWITGTARSLLDHYFTEEKTKVNVGMDVCESGPVSVDEPYSAFIMPMMSSGSVFEGSYGYVKGGIWRITSELGRINETLGVDVRVNCTVHEVDSRAGTIRYEDPDGEGTLHWDHAVFATDPQTAARISGDAALIAHTQDEQVLGTSGKLNLMFQNPVQWKDAVDSPESNTAFRYLFAVESLAEFDAATKAVVDGEDFAPGYFQVYCEGASMRRMGLDEPFERLAVFFKNLGLGSTGEQLAEVEEVVALTSPLVLSTFTGAIIEQPLPSVTVTV